MDTGIGDTVLRTGQVLKMESNGEFNEALRVITFGGFSMIWKDVVICGGVKSADSQFTRLMQILIHNRKLGVDRMQLQSFLFEDSGAEDVHHLLRSTIYKARKKLENAGLPESNYIVLKNGSYFWTPDIPVREDATDLEVLFAKAKQEEDPDKKKGLFIEACYCYNGDFLPQQTRLSWVAQEDRRYKIIFNSCVEEAAAKLREDGNWKELEKLGRHASRVCPLNEWELLTMDALISMGKCREARDLYEETVGFYQKELGATPSVEMVNKLREYASRIELPYIEPEVILEQMDEPEEEAFGGYYCSYYMFRAVYRMVRRVMDRYERQAFLVICSVNGEEAADDESSVRIKDIICGSIRKSDIVCQYSRSQFMLLLLTPLQEGCSIIMDRINSKIKDDGLSCSIEYKASPVSSP